MSSSQPSANKGSHQKARTTNHMKLSAPRQLEPNPVFSIIDQQMEKMNRTAQERELTYGSARRGEEMDGDQEMLI